MRELTLVLRAAAMTLGSVMILAGCSWGEAGDGGPESLAQIAATARKNGYDWQASLLDDGDITLAEYDEGHRRNLECLKAGGMTYTEPERNLPDGFRWEYVINWYELDEETGDRESFACFEKYLGDLELAMGAWGEWWTDPALLAHVEKCVTSAGFEVEPGVKNYREVWLSTSDQGATQQMVAGCVSGGMFKIYPGVAFGTGF